jgi:hypothetical protein
MLFHKVLIQYTMIGVRCVMTGTRITGPMYVGRTESHEQHFLYANWEQQTKEIMVVDGPICCVPLSVL